jgi:hypothetical protein
MDVGPSGEDDAVEVREQLWDRLDRERRDDHRHAAGDLDRPQVGEA